MTPPCPVARPRVGFGERGLAVGQRAVAVSVPVPRNRVLWSAVEGGADGGHVGYAHRHLVVAGEAQQRAFAAPH